MKILPLSILSLILFGAGCSVAENAANTAQGEQKPAVASVDTKTETSLDLSNQGLTSIPLEIFSRTTLTQLHLSKNRLTGAPQSQIGQLKHLRSLDLSNNELTGLPAELGQLSELEVLNVSKNQFTGLPMELGNLTQLRILDISGNPYSVRDLDEIASKLPNTKILR